MLTLQLPEWNTAELIKAFGTRWTGLGDFGPITLIYPAVKVVYDDRQPMWSMREGKGTMTLSPQNYPQCTAARVDIECIQRHCGLVTIGCVQVCHSNDAAMRQLWMRTIEDYLFYLGYSTVMGCDGTSSANLTRNFVVENSANWQIVELGTNRRMGSYTQSLFWKTLVKDNTLNIPWDNGVKQTPKA